MTDRSGAVVETPLGEVDYQDEGQGSPVLFVHGSPGGSDQGALMGRFLVSSGFRVVAPSRPGYLRTPLSDLTATPDAQADLLAAVMEALASYVSRWCAGPAAARPPTGWRCATPSGSPP